MSEGFEMRGEAIRRMCLDYCMPILREASRIRLFRDAKVVCWWFCLKFDLVPWRVGGVIRQNRQRPRDESVQDCAGDPASASTVPSR